jgi:hypothetical protein
MIKPTKRKTLKITSRIVFEGKSGHFAGMNKYNILACKANTINSRR